MAPDYSCLCRFINRHADTLTVAFFEDLTRSVCKSVGASSAFAAGDGTVIQAAASRYGTIKQEAAVHAAQEARAEAAAAPNDEEAVARAKQTAEVERVVRERNAQCKDHGREENARVSPSEPSAVVQPLKTGQVAPSYKPSVLVNDKRIIIAHAVHGSSETEPMAAMLAASARTTGQVVTTLALDAGYCCATILFLAVANELDLLCPEGQTNGDGPWSKKSKLFGKERFTYVESTDTYLCPGQRELKREYHTKASGRTPAYTRYRSSDCTGCPLQAQCTAKEGERTVRRYDHDPIKEILRDVMEHPLARKRYRRRQEMVEPVFGEIKHTQDLLRFRRRGARVALEWALHCSAHNLRRWERLRPRRAGRPGASGWRWIRSPAMAGRPGPRLRVPTPAWASARTVRRAILVPFGTNRGRGGVLSFCNSLFSGRGGAAKRRG